AVPARAGPRPRGGGLPLRHRMDRARVPHRLHRTRRRTRARDGAGRDRDRRGARPRARDRAHGMDRGHSTRRLRSVSRSRALAAAGARLMRTEWRDGDRTRTVEIEALGSNRYRVAIDGAALECEVLPLGDGRLRLATDRGVTIAEITA